MKLDSDRYGFSFRTSLKLDSSSGCSPHVVIAPYKCFPMARGAIVWLSLRGVFGAAVYEFTSYTELKTAVDSYCTDVATAEGTYGAITTWDVSRVNNMDSLFYSTVSGPCSTFNGDISQWDVGKVGSMRAMVRSRGGQPRPKALGEPSTRYCTRVPPCRPVPTLSRNPH